MTAIRCPVCGAELVSAAGDQTFYEAAADHDQGRADRDQTASDRDQTWADRDQTSSESDRRTSTEDQVASDDDLAAGGDPEVHDRSARARQRASEDRDAVSALREEASEARRRTGEERDLAAARRDRLAEERDARALSRDLDTDTRATLEDILFRARQDRARAAADRARAAEDRDRAANDRADAARERADALRHQAAAADDLRLATTDELTGARTRKPGLDEVRRELERAHRTGARLLLAFIDVNGLKQVNDKEGHLRGDALLRLVGSTLRANVRPYDVIVRYGGDELVCAMPNLSLPEARARFRTIAATLEAVDPEHSITFGLAEAEPADDLDALIARADVDLLRARHDGAAGG
jgi:diguanylate cyclase (GGDEF)-like protein